MSETYLTIRQFAAKGVISEHSIRQMVKQKKLPAVFVGKRAMLPVNLCMTALERMAGENSRATTE